MAGAAAGDYDGDGDTDVLLTSPRRPNSLYMNDGTGHFTEVAAQAGVAGPVLGGTSAAPYLVDVTGDGLVDIYLTGNSAGGNRLFANDGNGSFSDQTNAAGLLRRRPSAQESGSVPRPVSATFADWDNDGDLDLLEVEWFSPAVNSSLEDPRRAPQPNTCDSAALASTNIEGTDIRRSAVSAVYRNDGGRFVDHTTESGIDFDAIVGFTPTAADVDGDGMLDLLITGDACTSRVFHGNGDLTFEDITTRAGVGTDENGMGSVVADMNGDGNLDWFISSVSYPTADSMCPGAGLTGCSGNRLYLGNGAGRFIDSTDTFALRDGYWGWGAAAEDFNNDGLRDLILTNGYRTPDSAEAAGAELRFEDRFRDDPNRMWIGRPIPPWPQVSESIGLSPTNDGRALLPLDMENDGDLDVLIANTDAPPTLFRNDTTPGAHWLRLKLRQDGPNTAAIGARVVVHPGDGLASMLFEVRAGSSLFGSAPTDLHVGLGDIGLVPRIEVFWPGTTTPQVLRNVPVDTIMEVRR
ncbi:MAG: CRTAC1 family protein [Microthrixaceae bacterium]|nr:CRTAC1 family protein [Microthrixaceae bacterium]